MSSVASYGLAAPLQRVLKQLERDASELPAEELARRLLAMPERPPRALAKRLLAAAFGCPVQRLPETIALPRLASTLAGACAEVELSQAHFAVVDLETTGVSPERARILEIGAVRVRAGRCGDSFETLVDPHSDIPRSITALTGIGREQVRGAPALDAALAAFDAWLGNRSAPVLVAHNAGFDAGFLARGYRAARRRFWGNTVLCTHKLARRLLPELDRYHLDSVCAHFGIANAARHRALGDARATARAWVQLLELARQRMGAKTLADLIDLQALSLARLRRKLDRASAPPG